MKGNELDIYDLPGNVDPNATSRRITAYSSLCNAAQSPHLWIADSAGRTFRSKTQLPEQEFRELICTG